MERNIAILKDEDGVICNIYARVGTPYEYYDSYTDSYTASVLSKSLDSNLIKTDNFKLYCSLKNDDWQNLDTSKENISSLTLVGGIYHSPKEEDIQELYSLYKEIEGIDNSDVDFLVGFVNNSSDFDKAITNYRVYGKSKWEDYNGSFYGYLTVKDSDLSYEEFKDCLL